MGFMQLVERIPPWFWIALVTIGAVMGTVAYLILLERKVASWAQDRIGPNRVGLLGLVPFLPERLRHKGMFGLGQPMADGLKFLLKEDYRPGGVDRKLFTLAPMVIILVVIVAMAVIPWGGVKQTTRTHSLQELANSAMRVPAGVTVIDHTQATDGSITTTYRYPFQIADLNIGVLFIIAALSLAVYGIVIGGWASNNKYSFLGGMRATAQMISYEIPLGLALLCIIVMYGTLDLGMIVEKQAHYWAGFIPAWNIFTQPLAFFLFLVCMHAEANRAPFDLAEAEQELVGGYHTEYSAMRFALFFLAEYCGMIVTSSVCVALFFGGWHLPWLEWVWPALKGNVDPAHPALTTSLLACLVRSIVYFTKVMLIIFVFMWVRWSLPRFRFDQLMLLAWRAMIPMSLGLLVVTALAIYWLGADNALYRDQRVADGAMALGLLGGNVLVLAATMAVSTILPAPPATNRRLKVVGSRFERTPVPAGS